MTRSSCSRPLLLGLACAGLLAACSRTKATAPERTGALLSAEAPNEARVDTLRGRLSPFAREELRRRAGGARESVLLVVREADAVTCEDLGRQARALQRWASGRGAAFLVWGRDGREGRLATFLRRERMPAAAVFFADSVPRLDRELLQGSPAAFLVRTATGEVHGVAHRGRVPNVRRRSFAEELEGLSGG